MASRCPVPVINAAQLASLLAQLGAADSSVSQLDLTFPAATGVPGARRAVAQLSTTPLSSGARPGLLLLSDRGIDAERAPLPALLATAAVWKAMVRAGWWDVPLIVESAQVFDTHHVALLVACGASAVMPSLALQFAAAPEIVALEPRAVDAVSTAIHAGLRKVLARMGVSTLASYRNSHLFEIVGLAVDVCDEFFEDAADFPGQKSLDDVLSDYLRMHTTAFSGAADDLADYGLYRFRKGAELHANSPEVLRRLHSFVKAPEAKKFSAFEELAEQQGSIFLRDLLETTPDAPVPLEEVESSEAILKRFSTQAMSLGSLGAEAHRTLAEAMNSIGARSNTGEGGEDPANLSPRTARREQDQASGFGKIWRYRGLPGARRRTRDQDGARLEARRRRAAAGEKSDRVHRANSPRHTGNTADFPAASSRYLQHRRPGAAHS